MFKNANLLSKLFPTCLAVSLLISTFGGCKTAADSPPPQETKTKTTADSLYDEVLELHDMAMPKMGKLIGYQKIATQKIDSINVLLKTRKTQALVDTKRKYEQVLSQLKAAEKGMNDWMEGFNPDPKFPTNAEMVGYFEDQKQKAAKMKIDMFSALDSAASKLKE